MPSPKIRDLTEASKAAIRMYVDSQEQVELEPAQKELDKAEIVKPVNWYVEDSDSMPSPKTRELTEASKAAIRMYVDSQEQVELEPAQQELNKS